MEFWDENYLHLKKNSRSGNIALYLTEFSGGDQLCGLLRLARFEAARLYCLPV